MAEEHARARALCEIAIDIETLDMAELIWKKYIDIETQLNETENVRNLYERLLQRTQHFKVRYNKVISGKGEVGVFFVLLLLIFLIADD